MLKITPRLSRQLTSTSAKYLSTSVQPQTKERSHIFRTNETSPSKHSYNQIGQFYRIDENQTKNLFLYGGIPKVYREQVKTFTENCIMIREPAVDIINCMKNMDYSKPAVKFALYGRRGNGKSVTLTHLLHYAHETGHIIMHVPFVGHWMRRCKEYSNSETKEGFVDINIDAAAWLLHMKTQNSHLLNDPKMVTSNKYEWSKREVTEVGSSLLDLIDHGMNRIKYACGTVTALCAEIKELSKKNVCKTFVAIDGYNGFFYPVTRIFTVGKKERVHPSKITITEGFMDLTKSDWNNAVCVLTLDELAMAYEDQKSHLPRHLLGKEGFDYIDPFIPICVPEYSDKEFLSCMEYYRDRKWVRPLPGMDDELQFLSTQNPLTLMNLCAGL